jgi:hypothetical protein
MFFRQVYKIIVVISPNKTFCVAKFSAKIFHVICFVLFTEVKQRPHLLLPVPNPAGSQVHPLRQRPAQGPETFQPTPQYHLRFKGKKRR